MNPAEIERLAWLIAEVEKHGRNVRLSSLASNEVDLLLVTTSMLESGFRLSKAIQVLIRNDLHLEAGPLERCLWELWDDFRYLVRTPGSTRNATKVLVTAYFEVADFLATHPRTASHEPSEGVRKILTRYEVDHPDIVAEVTAQRKKRLYHWSGLRRAARVKGISDASHLYRLLSWEVHAVMGPVRDIAVRTSKGKARVVFDRKDDIFANAPRLAWTCGGILFHMWNEYATRWKMRAIELPEAFTSGRTLEKARSQPQKPGIMARRSLNRQGVRTTARK